MSLLREETLEEEQFWRKSRKRMGFSDSSVCKESTCNAGDRGEESYIRGQEDPLEEGMATHHSVLA